MWEYRNTSSEDRVQELEGMGWTVYGVELSCGGPVWQLKRQKGRCPVCESFGTDRSAKEHTYGPDCLCKRPE